VAEKAYFSYQTGFVKPDPRAWQVVLDENALLPNECIFFDDQPRNVEAAKSLGMPAFLYEAAEAVRQKLA
jgi:HAD superfamily hydrolase (TIGR01509 family)